MSGEHQLPPGIGPGAPDVDADPGGAEARGHAMVNQAGGAVLDGGARELPGWVTRPGTRRGPRPAGGSRGASRAGCPGGSPGCSRLGGATEPPGPEPRPTPRPGGG